VLDEMLGLSPQRFEELRAQGVFGKATP